MDCEFYEIDFLPVGEGKKSGDAIALRYRVGDKSFIHVVDGGTLDSGQKLSDHISTYYDGATCVDHVVCTHADGDHSSGLCKILETKVVGTLWMNRPWLYVDEIFPLVDDGRITKSSLKQRLRNSYSYISKLETLALEKGIEIKEAFTGEEVGAFTICSPSRSTYIDLLVETNKTPSMTILEAAYEAAAGVIQKAANWLPETWGSETLRENSTTSAENEMSVVQYAVLDGVPIVLTGDAGPRALTEAADFAAGTLGHVAGELKFMQVPHHGSRHNVTPTVLDKWLGKAPDEEVEPALMAFASVAKEADSYPRRAVVNGFYRRGFRVYSTKGSTICHDRNGPDRGWSSLSPHPFSNKVEDWD